MLTFWVHLDARANFYLSIESPASFELKFESLTLRPSSCPSRGIHFQDSDFVEPLLSLLPRGANLRTCAFALWCTGVAPAREIRDSKLSGFMWIWIILTANFQEPFKFWVSNLCVARRASCTRVKVASTAAWSCMAADSALSRESIGESAPRSKTWARGMFKLRNCKRVQDKGTARQHHPESMHTQRARGTKTYGLHFGCSFTHLFVMWAYMFTHKYTHCSFCLGSMPANGIGFICKSYANACANPEASVRFLHSWFNLKGSCVPA
jgi:hypothetical protein